MNAEDQIYENQRLKATYSFWLTIMALSFIMVSTISFMYSQYRTPEAVHAANCKATCSYGVKSFEGGDCICLVPPLNPPVRDVKALSCTCMPIPVGEEEKREDAMRRMLENDAMKNERKSQ